jgi:hypothetical protein
MLDKTLVTIVTRDNPILLKHCFTSLTENDPGIPCNFRIIDHESQTPEQKKLLDNLSSQADILSRPNNRVEASFKFSGEISPNYKYYFFVHDDCIAIGSNWLKAFRDRMDSGYYEPIIGNTHLKNLPIGRVGTLHHPWRDYASILGYPVQCHFVKPCIESLFNGQRSPEIFKYCDSDRVFISNDCIKEGECWHSVADYKDRPVKLGRLEPILDRYLPYTDEGMYPKNLYPPGQYWSRITLLCEFMNSIMPLLNGFRTVGLEGDGYLEQINGYDVPWGHWPIAHYGSPNSLQFLAKVFNTDYKEVKKKFNNPTFLLMVDRLFKNHYRKN